MDKKRIRYILILVIASILFVGFNAGSYDDYFLINSGREIINKGFIYKEPFSMHKDLDIIMPQWLFSVILYLLYSIFDFYAILILIAICSIIINLLLFKLCYLVSDNLDLSFLCTFGSFLLPMGPFLECRPQLFSYIAILLTLIILEYYIRKNNWKILLGLPLVFIFLINSHATMIIFLYAAIFCYLFNFIHTSNVNEKYKYKKFPIIIFTIISTFATLLNPYKIESLLYIFKSISKSVNVTSKEMSVTSIFSLGGFFIYSMIIILAIIFYKHKNKIECHLLLFLIGSFFVGLIAQRNVFALAFSFPVFISNYLFDIEVKFKKIKHPQIFVYVLMLGELFTTITGTKWTTLEYEYSDVKDYIINNIEDYENKSFYSDTESGSYLQFYGIKTFVDNRREIYLKRINNKSNILNDYCDLQQNEKTFKEINDIYNFDYLVITSKDNLYDKIDKENVTLMHTSFNLKDVECKLYKVNN